MKVLGIETSCDETGIAIYDAKLGLLAHCLHSQVKMHAEYGGVVPELASRDHIRKTLPLIDQVMQAAKITPEAITGIAYTAGPGLAGALLVGAAIAQSLAFAWDKPVVPVHHMEGHLLASMLEETPPSFPFVALLVSGGHTQLVAVADVGCYTLLGESIDDAAGEAFDKTAKLLDLGYPGGALLAKIAEQGETGRFYFPRPMMDRPGCDFSFSGLKTNVRNTIAANLAKESLGSLSLQMRADIALAFEEAVIETLVIKCKRALHLTGFKTLVTGGGVSANQSLRRALQAMVAEEDATVFFPRPEFCTDNGAMIAYAGYLHLKKGEQGDLGIKVYPRWSL